MNASTIKSMRPSRRGAVLSILGVITLGVALLSVAVSYRILEPQFGKWAVPTVGALDALWVVFQATEILAGNNRRRARRVQIAGLALTAVNAAIPTAHLVMSGPGGFDLAYVLTPVAIVGTKVAWWWVLPSLGRRVSAGTRQALDTKRQEVDDRLEEMEAEAAHRIELLELATELETQVAKAETRYRRSVLKAQQTMTANLHKQAEATEKTVTEKALPAAVTAIRLPELGQWTPTAPALPVTADRDATGTPTPALPRGRHTHGTQVNEGADDKTARKSEHTVTLDELAAVAGVPVPVPGVPLTDDQMGVVLRHLRYSDDPPLSYRKARADYRGAGYVGSEERVRHVWSDVLAAEDGEESSEDADDSEDEDADA
ncbi:hypothetical protein QJ054_36050 [Streptomyces sp. AN-3]|uniref:hypothetical protein n=1 Tax=Streptomyces sp. AN-3 TaxID=3044177 RepID=UPI00249A6532|nr:hypothetical protein [Streptomyces sp. AN-3]MDI3102439.1 hypothetical protein [Streptomyces sp. AN-3]